MTTDVWKPKPPKPPSLGMMIAVFLEVCIVVTFIANRSLMGLALCGAYSWFSATWALFQQLSDDDE